MKRYEFAGLPSTSSVAAAVTLSVCTWFLVAAGLMVTDQPGQGGYLAAPQPTPVVYTAPAVAISPEARLIIVVEGRRA